MSQMAMMFSGGMDTTLAAARILDHGEVERLHLLTFCNGLCVGVERSQVHAQELRAKYGADRVVHEIMYVTELFEAIRSPLPELILEARSSLIFDLCCRLSMETRAIMYALDHGIGAIADGTNIDQGKLFLERPEYLRVAREYFASFGIDYTSPVYARSGGRKGRWEELVQRGFTVGPPQLEWLNINACIMQQPFCLFGIHTFFFTSFVRNAPVLRRLIRRLNLPLDRAIGMRRDRQDVARRLVEEHVSFHEATVEGIRISEQFCTTKLCGQNSVELAFPRGTRIDVESLAGLWAGEGVVSREGALVSLRSDGVELRAFPDGRVVVRGTRDRAEANALFERLVAPHDVFDRPG
jgi:hypothetical protein